MAYHLDGQGFLKSDLYIEKLKAVQVSSLDIAQRCAVLRKFPNVDIVCISTEASLFGTEYAQEMIITAGHSCGQPECFKILSIVV